MRRKDQPPEEKAKVRSLGELMAPDPRSASLVRVNLATGETAPNTIQHAEQVLGEIEAALTPGVPEKIRERVRVTRSLVVYGWFCYDFYAASMFWSFSCIEMALWAKYGEMKAEDSSVEKHRSLRSLLEWAAKEQLLPENTSADGIRQFRNSMAHPKHFNVVVPPGPAVDCFDLLVRILAQMWPIVSEP